MIQNLGMMLELTVQGPILSHKQHIYVAPIRDFITGHTIWINLYQFKCD